MNKDFGKLIKAYVDAEDQQLRSELMGYKMGARDRCVEAGLRAALRALAAQFRDPVVVNALLWAAAEGEVKA